MTEAPETGPAANPPEIRLSRTFQAPRARVFKGWTTAEHVKRWFCPAGYGVPVANVASEIGGRFEVCMRSPEGVEHWIRGRFTELVPVSRLAIEMDATDAAGHRLFTARTIVSFADEAAGTRMELIQAYAIHDPIALRMIEGASEGWRQTLARLGSVLAETEKGSAVRSIVHATFPLERRYRAPLAGVWKALTEEEAKARWFGGPATEWTLLERQMDVRVGGRERVQKESGAMLAPAGFVVAVEEGALLGEGDALAASLRD